MKSFRMIPFFAALAVLLMFAGCKKEEAAPVVVAPLHAPASQTDEDGWKKYLQDVITCHSQGVTDRSTAYYLPAPGGPEYDGMYQRQASGIADAVSRGLPQGNLLAFMSPDSTKMADLMVAAFTKNASPGSMKGSIILFVGKAADNERVKAAVTPSGAEYRFVEAN